MGLCLDLVVVVLGIFLGLQAADWNQARIDRLEMHYHLNFLYDEVVTTTESEAQEIEASEATLGGSFGAAMLLNESAWGQDQEAAFKQDISSTYELWGPTYRPVSLRRMVDDGKLDLVESKVLQNAILQYDSAYLDAIEQTKTSYNHSLALTPKITASMKFNGRNIVSSSEELLSNDVLRAVVRDKAIWQRIQLDVLVRLQEERKKLKEILEAAGYPT